MYTKFQAIRNLKNSLSKVDIDAAAKEAVEARSYEISRLNQEQLQQGKRANDTTLPNYSPVSVEEFGKPPGPIKLFDTGDFYESIKPSFFKKDFSVDAADQKTAILKAKYGSAIVGLSDDSVGELAQDSLGQVQYELREQIGI